jgi:hypothetical protein
MHAACATVVEGAEATNLLLFQAPDFAAAEQEAGAYSHVHSLAFDATVSMCRLEKMLRSVPKTAEAGLMRLPMSASALRE